MYFPHGTICSAFLRLTRNQFELFTNDHLRVLLDLAMDAYDDVRSCSITLLKQASSDIMREWLLDTEQAVDKDILASAGQRRPSENSTRNNRICTVLRWSEDLMRKTGRADFSDGFGRLNELTFDMQLRSTSTVSCARNITYGLLSDIERDIQTAQQNLSQAVATAPVHGRMIALRYLPVNARSSTVCC